MFERIANSWELVKASAGVLCADKELVIFPILSSLGVLIVMVSFALPAAFAGLFDAVADGRQQVLGLVVAFLFYLVQYFIIIFANSALVGAAMIRLQGGDPTVGDGLRIASSRVGSILGYALISATVGMVLRSLSERGRGVGRIAGSILGLAWSVVTYLVIPVLVAEDAGPVDAIRRSGRLLKKTWGEQIVGSYSIGLVFGLISLAVLLLAVPVAFLAVNVGSVALLVAAVLFFVLVLAILGVISSTLSGIYSAAVYRYSVTGETGSFFRQGLVQHAFRPK